MLPAAPHQDWSNHILIVILRPLPSSCGAHAGYADPVRFLSRVTALGPNWVRLERPIPVRVSGGV